MIPRIPAVKLTIHFGDASGYPQKVLSASLMGVLREHDLARATIIQGEMGYGRSRRIYSLMNEVAMANLPLTIEVVDERGKIECAVPFIVEMLAGRGLVQVQQTAIVPTVLEGVRERSKM
jgi:PII-like signaling protein